MNILAALAGFVAFGAAAYMALILFRIREMVITEVRDTGIIPVATANAVGDRLMTVCMLISGVLVGYGALAVITGVVVEAPAAMAVIIVKSFLLVACAAIFYILRPTIVREFVEAIQAAAFRGDEYDLALDLLHGLREAISGFALVAYDGDLKYLWYTKDYADLLGIDPAPQVGSYHWDAFPHLPHSIRPDMDTYIEAALAGKKFRMDADTYMTPHGQKKLMWWEIGPWYKRDRVIGGYYVLFGDVTNEVNEIARLERKVNERTREARRLRETSWAKLVGTLDYEAGYGDVPTQ